MAVEYTQAVQDRWGTKIVEGRVVGRNNTVIPPQEVEDLAALGCKDTEIAAWFGVNDNTLRYQFSEELTKGRENLKQSLRRAQLKAALSGNVVMLIWLGKNILGQSETPQGTQAEVLPFTDDELDEIKDNLEDELDELDAAE
jgi:hypothetical protein